MIIGVTGAADHSRLFSTIGVIAVMLLMSAIGCVYLFAFRCRRCRKSLAMIRSAAVRHSRKTSATARMRLDLELETDAARNA